MFYDQLMKLCEKNGTKPTPLVKSLGMSTGSIKNWKEGTLPSGEVLMRFSEFFDVSIDYLVYGKEDVTQPPPAAVINQNHIVTQTEDEADLLTYFRKMSRKEQRQLLVQMENSVEERDSAVEQSEDSVGKSLA